MAENDSEDTGFEPKHAVETMTEIDSDDTRLELKHVQSTRSTRGKVQLNKLLLRRARGIIQEVEFNKHGHPFGPVASEMQSYIGLLARQEVKISYKSWKLVPNEVKEFIWESVNVSKTERVYLIFILPILAVQASFYLYIFLSMHVLIFFFIAVIQS